MWHRSTEQMYPLLFRLGLMITKCNNIIIIIIVILTLIVNINVTPGSDRRRSTPKCSDTSRQTDRQRQLYVRIDW